MAAAAGEKNRPHTAIVCDYDPIWLGRAVARVKDAGFAVLGEATNVVSALRLSNDLQPSLVVITNEHSGLTVMDAVVDFRRQDHAPEVLVLSTSEVDRHVFLQRGALLLVGRFDHDAFDRALEEAKEYLTTGERRKSDRRRNGDRRVRQDWRLVTKERRSNVDRRRAQRRAASVHAAADASVPRPAPDRPLAPDERRDLDDEAAAKIAAELAAEAVAAAVRRQGVEGAGGPSRAQAPVPPPVPQRDRAISVRPPSAPAPAAKRSVAAAPATAAELQLVMARAVARATALAAATETGATHAAADTTADTKTVATDTAVTGTALTETAATGTGAPV